VFNKSNLYNKKLDVYLFVPFEATFLKPNYLTPLPYAPTWTSKEKLTFYVQN
jgi:hypothetical protein